MSDADLRVVFGWLGGTVPVERWVVVLAVMAYVVIVGFLSKGDRADAPHGHNPPPRAWKQPPPPVQVRRRVVDWHEGHALLACGHTVEVTRRLDVLPCERCTIEGKRGL